jgi:quinol monooxygenase YgiN
MVTIIIRVKTIQNKHQEFEQIFGGLQIEDTEISGLLKEWRNEKGCISHHLYKEEEDKFCLVSEWQSWEDIESHFRSMGFTLLMGAIDVLCETPEVNIADGKSSFGIEAIKAARGEQNIP